MKVRDIEEKAPASEFETVEESKTDEARAEEPAEDSTSEEEAGEALGEAQTEVAALTPVKRTVAVDRSLQPVSAATWDTAYKQNTSKSSSPLPPRQHGSSAKGRRRRLRRRLCRAFGEGDQRRPQQRLRLLLSRAGPF
ncbi:MAG: hypothetical protein M5R36_20890 [Deltaproteobacteria bacterium]|nr:hypothetical protein [Deltaproteobacteria bacterium]